MTVLIPVVALGAVAAMLATLHAATRLPATRFRSGNPSTQIITVSTAPAVPAGPAPASGPTQTIPAVGHATYESPLVRPYVYGRHAAATASLRRVPADWTPPVGAGRLRAAVDDTAQMPAVRVDVRTA